MRIASMICAVTIVAAALVVTLVFAAPETMPVALLGGSAITAAILRRLLTRFAPHWQAASAIGVAASALPSALWLVAFAADMTAIVQNQLDPQPGFMIGFSIMLFLPCLIAFVPGLAAAWLVGPKTPSS